MKVKGLFTAVATLLRLPTRENKKQQNFQLKFAIFLLKCINCFLPPQLPINFHIVEFNFPSLLRLHETIFSIRHFTRFFIAAICTRFHVHRALIANSSREVLQMQHMALE